VRCAEWRNANHGLWIVVQKKPQVRSRPRNTDVNGISALDHPPFMAVGELEDVGYAAVVRAHSDGRRSVVQHEMTFAFVFKAFYPDGVIVSE
jgi:hypothetical protein